MMRLFTRCLFCADYVRDWALLTLREPLLTVVEIF